MLFQFQYTRFIINKRSLFELVFLILYDIVFIVFINILFPSLILYKNTNVL